MSEIDAGQFAQLLGVTRKYLNDRLKKRPDFPKPCSAWSRKSVRWRYADALRFKEGKK
jgi:predicted DNA-binding transcriptional regulator AlpA